MLIDLVLMLRRLLQSGLKSKNAYLLGNLDFVMALQIGRISIREPVILAPMSGITDLPFRKLVKSFGAGLVVSEMVASSTMTRANSRTRRMLEICETEAPVAIQLLGREPNVMGVAALFCQDLGASMIDINFGCPAKKVVSGAAGSALMREEVLAAKILGTVVNSVQIPVTVKMRTGWDDQNRNAPRLAKIAEDTGVQQISVHGRTRCQFYNGKADWNFIAEVKDAVNVPVIGNGDIVAVEDAAALIKTAKVDGVMVGRGIQGRPWFLSHIIHYLETGQKLEVPSIDVRLGIVLNHFDMMLSHYGVERGLRVWRKHLAWYTKKLTHVSSYRERLFSSDNPLKIKHWLRNLFDAELAVTKLKTVFQ